MTTRDAYIKKFKAQLEQWDAQIDRLEAKAREASADAKIEYEQQLRQIRERRDEARAKIDELRRAGGEAWEDIKDGADEAWTACRNAIEAASERFK